MARKLGRSGETRFANLVAEFEGGATCNDSHEDAHGWDHVVEFDPHPVEGLPADLQRELPAVFVQTKTRAEPSDLTVVVKLSNALRFTRSDHPCFVVLVVAPPRAEPRFFAVHWWDALMARSLERARRLHLEGVDEAAFNRRSFTFRMRPEDEKSGPQLVGWLRDTVEAAGRNYALEKARLRETVGYGDDRFSGTIQVGPLGSLEELVDHQLGLTPNIPVARITFNNRRFALDAPFPLPDGPPTFVSMTAHPVATCEVRARGPDGTEFTTRGDVIAPAIPDLPEELRKLRIRTPLFDLIWKPAGSISFNCDFDTRQRRPIGEWETIARLISWSGIGTIDVTMRIDDNRVLAGEATLAPPPDAPGWRILAPQLASIAALAAYRTTAPAMISLEEAKATPGLFDMHCMLAATETTITANLAPGQLLPAFDHGVGFGILTVGDWVFTAVARFPLLSFDPDPPAPTAVFGKAVILESHVFETTDQTGFVAMQDDYERLARRPGALPLDNIPLGLSANPAAQADAG